MSMGDHEAEIMANIEASLEEARKETAAQGKNIKLSYDQAHTQVNDLVEKYRDDDRAGNINQDPQQDLVEIANVIYADIVPDGGGGASAASLAKWSFYAGAMIQKLARRGPKQCRMCGHCDE